jgi:hypothetical protein
MSSVGVSQTMVSLKRFTGKAFILENLVYSNFHLFRSRPFDGFALRLGTTALRGCGFQPQ